MTVPIAFSGNPALIFARVVESSCIDLAPMGSDIASVVQALVMPGER